MTLKDSYDDANDFPDKKVIVRPMNGNDTLFLIGILQHYGWVNGQTYEPLRNNLDGLTPNTQVAIRKGERIPCGFAIREDKGFDRFYLYHDHKPDARDVIGGLARAAGLLTLAKEGGAGPFAKMTRLNVPTTDGTGAEALLDMRPMRARTTAILPSIAVDKTPYYEVEIDGLVLRYARPGIADMITPKPR